MRRYLVLAVSVVMCAAACTSGSSSPSGGGSTATTAASGGGSSTTLDPKEVARAPGVTATSIKIGVNYVDEVAIRKQGINFKLGDYKASYQELAKQINAKGGINGRKLELSFAAINPVDATSVQSGCTKLTQDDKVFLTVGFFLNDGVLCTIETNQTAVVGGLQTAKLVARAKAPWFTTTPGPELPRATVKAFSDHGDLKGKVAVFVTQGESSVVDDDVAPALKDVGVKTVSKGVLDAPVGDNNAIKSGVQTIAQRFKAAGADTVILVGQNAEQWLQYMADDSSYRPKLLLTEPTAAQAFLGTNPKNLDILKGSLLGGPFGPDQAIYDEPKMSACLATLKAAGIDVPEPDPSDANQKAFTGPEDACTEMALVTAIITKAGKALNYATFRNAGYSLGSLAVPGDPTPRDYGPPPATDGKPSSYLSQWDPATKLFAVIK